MTAPRIKFWLAAAAAVGIFSLSSGSRAEAPSEPAHAAADHQPAKALLQRYCFDCHAADVQEANVRLDTLELSGEHGEVALMQRVLDALEDGRMPPEEAELPAVEERDALKAAFEARLLAMAAEARAARGPARTRRLTAEEYNHTMQELFEVDAGFAGRLSPDPISADGYLNNAELLGFSDLQIEAYLDSARRAVQRYVRFGEPSEQPVRYHIEFEELFYSTAERYKSRSKAPRPIDEQAFDAQRAANRAGEPQYVLPLTPAKPGGYSEDEAYRAAIPKLHQEFLAIPEVITVGELVVRVRAAGTADRDGRFPRMRVEAGITLGDGCAVDKRVVGEVDVDAPLDQPKVYEFRMRMEDVPAKGPFDDEKAFDKPSVFDMNQVFISNASSDDAAIFELGRGGYPDPDAAAEKIGPQHQQMAEAGVNFLHLDCIEIEMLPGRTASGPYVWSVDMDRVQRGGDEQTAAAADFLRHFMPAAYRRPVSEQEVAAKLELLAALADSGYSFEESLRETLAAVLVSPSFLFLEFDPTRSAEATEADPHALASRLAYFLWLSPPDERLRKAANDGTILDREVLNGEAERMLRDPKARRFLDSFCRQWLRLDKHSHVPVDRSTYPTYDADLAAAAVCETLNYFGEVFRSDANALELIDSDYAVINDRLADHYGIEGVRSGDFQKVDLPEGSARGGLLTQASVLTMNSDGVDSHPIRRGVWLLDRLLHDPPPPPPPNVPALNANDPDFRGLSLKEKIALHREPGACQSCHRKIDPWGIALENFDATGRWRDTISAAGDAVPVDAAVELPGGQAIDGVHGLKAHILEERREQFGRAMAHHMLTYALGRSLDYADRSQVEAIHKRFAAADYRLRELVLAVVDSDAFRD